MQSLSSSHTTLTEPERLAASGDTSELENIRSFVAAKARAFGFNEQGILKITLAVDEACSNLIRHSYNHDHKKTFFVEIRLDEGSASDVVNNDANTVSSPDQTPAKNAPNMVIEIHDSGSAFNPMTVAAPNLKEYAEQHRRGGFGVHIIRMTMDKIEYFPADALHTMNRFRLTKKVN